MDTETASGEIIAIRKRLREIEEERDVWGDDPFIGKMDLLAEEHELHTRLGELQYEFSRNQSGVEDDLELHPRRPTSQPLS